MDKEKTVDVLNELVEINNDRIAGYETAIKETEDADLIAMFSQFVRTSQSCKAELVSEVRKLGGTPEEGTRTDGKLYRAWMDLKAALTGKDRKAILDSCEYGEDVALDTYHHVLKNHLEDITAEQHTLIDAQHTLIKADHNRVKNLRDVLVDSE
jgi:uncharacterized protein (TIGR02284 family)